jgi:uncharacterized protein (DUF952 family)
VDEAANRSGAGDARRCGGVLAVRCAAARVRHTISNSEVGGVSNTIYKICDVAVWRNAEVAGKFHGAAIDEHDGYIHFSSASQVKETAAKHFSGAADLVLIAIDAGRLGSALRWEPAREGALFPHLYGELPLDCVLWVKPLPLGADGRHVFPELMS